MNNLLRNSEVKVHWREHFSDLLNHGSQVDFSVIEELLLSPPIDELDTHQDLQKLNWPSG